MTTQQALVARPPFALHFREAPENSDEGKEESSQANACQRSPESSDANIFDSD
jgi:hypothetical protein